MRALLQRVTSASVAIQDGTEGTFSGIIEGEPRRDISRGLVVFLGVGEDDSEAEAERLWRKISRLRIFDDEAGKTNLSLADVDGEVLVVSQFTLYANCRRGNRPSFTEAGNPQKARELYRYFCQLAQNDLGSIAVGEFGADMHVSIENSGPFTIWLDTNEL